MWRESKAHQSRQSRASEEGVHSVSVRSLSPTHAAVLARVEEEVERRRSLPIAVRTASSSSVEWERRGDGPLRAYRTTAEGQAFWAAVGRVRGDEREWGEREGEEKARE